MSNFYHSLLFIALALHCNAFAQQDAAFASMTSLCGNITPPYNYNNESFGPVKKLNLPNSGQEIAYVSFGNTSSTNPPIIFIYGLTDTLKTIPYNLLIHLSKEQQVIAFDLPGQGLSGASPQQKQKLALRDVVNDTANFIQALNLSTQPTIIGYDAGGFLALELLRPPYNTLIFSAVIASSAPGSSNMIPTPSAAGVRLLNATKTQYDVLKDSYDFEAPASKTAACERYGGFLYAGINSLENKASTGRFFQAINEWEKGIGVWDILPSVTNPVWFIAGVKDELVMPENSRLMASRVSKSWLTMLPGKHSALAEDSGIFIDVYNAFLKTFYV